MNRILKATGPAKKLRSAFSTATQTKPFQLTVDTLNENFRLCQFPVRGEIYFKTMARVAEGKEVIFTNVGNPHQLGQIPIKFNREVMALCAAPFLLERPDVNQIFSPDSIARAKIYLDKISGGIGAYTDSKGALYVRQEIAAFINKMSGQPVDPENIFIQNGASECARLLLQGMLRGPQDGVLVPIPQYPLYSASIQLSGGELVGYYLDEEKGWSLNIEELQKKYDEAKARGVTTRALVFINPGNPTGKCLNEDNIKELIYFAYKNNVILIADEVYMENIYNPDRPFIFTRKVLGEMPEPIKSGLELLSFHTASKGPYGECGLRGGYMEFHNFHPDVVQEMYKIASINLCSNVLGQIALGLMVNPPKPGDYSHDSYFADKNAVNDSLKRRARKITDAFNRLEGINCQDCEGAMYSYPQITLPAGALEAAKKLGKAADVMYCLELLDETGICCVPGSGFKQVPGTFHFRTTILPPEEQFDDIITRFTKFHQGFMKRYSK